MRQVVCIMRKMISFLIIFGLIPACNSESDKPIIEEESPPLLSFQYSFAIKSAKGEALICLPGITYSDLPGTNENRCYTSENTNIYLPNQIEAVELRYSFLTDEARIVVNTDCKALSSEYLYSADLFGGPKSIDTNVVSLLELQQQAEGCGFEDILTYDRITCYITIMEDTIICNNIKVNGQVVWERSYPNEEPFFELEKDYPIGYWLCGDL